MKIISFFLLAFCLASSLNAQTTKGYEEGFVITNAGDTVRGIIKHKSGDEIKDRIYLKISEEDKRTYKVGDIQFFQAGNESYIVEEVDGEKAFLLEWSVGALELYEQQIVSTDGIVSYQAYIRKAGEKQLIPVKVNSWKKQILPLISDDTQLVLDVEKGKYKIDDLGNIIKQYNMWKDEQ